LAPDGKISKLSKTRDGGCAWSGRSGCYVGLMETLHAFGVGAGREHSRGRRRGGRLCRLLLEKEVVQARMGGEEKRVASGVGDVGEERSRFPPAVPRKCSLFPIMSRAARRLVWVSPRKSTKKRSKVAIAP